MTFIEGPLVRSVGPDSFADIAPAVRFTFQQAGLDFDADLTLEQVAAIYDRMTSRDDTDQAERARIAAALDGGAINLAEMLAERELGRPVREPIYPQ